MPCGHGQFAVGHGQFAVDMVLVPLERGLCLSFRYPNHELRWPLIVNTLKEWGQWVEVIFGSVFSVTQIIGISNFRSLSFIVNILWLF